MNADRGLAVLTKKRLETLAALEHDQWVEWSRTVATQGLTPERLARWERYWVPYAELDEETKEHDRKWARLVIAAILGERSVFLLEGVGWLESYRECSDEVQEMHRRALDWEAEIERLQEQIARQATTPELAIAFDAVRAEAKIANLCKIEKAARAAADEWDAATRDWLEWFARGGKGFHVFPVKARDALRAALAVLDAAQKAERECVGDGMGNPSTCQIHMADWYRDQPQCEAHRAIGPDVAP